jgi:DNA-binding NarL/FixJ family response regulator
MIAKSAEAQKGYRVLIADDHPVVRQGLRRLLEPQPGVEVCCEATTGTEALDLVKKGKPDLVVLDLTMPELNGLEAAREIHEVSPQTKILILSIHFSKEIAQEALRSGARLYILKSDADSDLVSAIEHLRQGKPLFTSRLAASMADSFLHGRTAEETALPKVPLTNREVEIVQLLSEGKSNKEVASMLGVSTRTVESHRNHIMHKMSFESFSDLVHFAIRNSLIEA